MQQVMKQPRAGVPFKRAGYYFVSRNNVTQNQDVTYVASSLEELLAGRRVLVDPNTFSADGASSLTSLTVSGDGQLVAYGVSEAGSDWTTFRLLNLGSGDQVEDALIQTKFSQAEWLPDHRCYVYTHFDHEGHVDGTQTAALSAHPKLRVHRIGDSQDHDELRLGGWSPLSAHRWRPCDGSDVISNAQFDQQLCLGVGRSQLRRTVRVGVP